MSKSASAVSPLRNRPFRRLWAGNLISLAGDQFYLVALPWLAFERMGSAGALGGILTAAAARAAGNGAGTGRLCDAAGGAALE